MHEEEQRCETDKGAYQDKHVVRDDAEHHEYSKTANAKENILTPLHNIDPYAS